MNSKQLKDFVAAAIVLGFTVFYVGMELTGQRIDVADASVGIQVLVGIVLLAALIHLFGDAVPEAVASLRDVRADDDEDAPRDVERPTNVADTPDEDPRDDRDG